MSLRQSPHFVGTYILQRFTIHLDAFAVADALGVANVAWATNIPAVDLADGSKATLPA